MNIIGFDISKNEIVGVRIDRNGGIKESFTILNNQEEITNLLERMRAKYPKFVAASEATAEYHRILTLECLRLGIPFRLLNPICTKQFTRATVRKKKTDLSDALIIAKLALQKEGALINKESFNPLKTISRTGYKLIRMSLMLHLMRERVLQILPEEKELIGCLEIPLISLKESIKKIQERVNKEVDSSLKELLCSLPGIGITIANTLICEIGDINRFPSAKSLVAFTGLDPKVRQSGQTLKRNTHLTKRGSPYLRRAVYLAATIAQRHDPELKYYYEKKRSEGKRYKEATISVARKLLNRIYAVWKRGAPYIKSSIRITLSVPQKVLT